MNILTSLVFAVALLLSTLVLLGWGSTLVDRKSRGTDVNIILASLAWGLFYFLTH
jgi:hypothetical protein